MGLKWCGLIENNSNFCVVLLVLMPPGKWNFSEGKWTGKCRVYTKTHQENLPRVSWRLFGQRRSVLKAIWVMLIRYCTVDLRPSQAKLWLFPEAFNTLWTLLRWYFSSVGEKNRRKAISQWKQGTPLGAFPSVCLGKYQAVFLSVCMTSHSYACMFFFNWRPLNLLLMNVFSAVILQFWDNPNIMQKLFRQSSKERRRMAPTQSS